MTNLAQRIDALLDATARQAAAKARVDKLRTILTRDLIDEAARDGVDAVTKKIKGAGIVRLDPATDWTPVVADRDVLAAHLADHKPSALRATITVPFEHLDAALDAARAACGVGAVDHAVETIPDEVAAYLATVELHVADTVGDDGRYAFAAYRPDDETGEAVEVPGLGITRTREKLVVTLDREARRAAEAQATIDLEDGDDA